MADEEKKAPKKEGGETEGKQAESPKAQEKSGLLTKKNILILITLILVLGGGTAGVLMKLSAKHNTKDPKEKKQEEAAHSALPTYLYNFKPLVVNISGTNGVRYLKITLSVQYEEKELDKEIEARLAEFMDTMNTIFSSKTLDQVVEVPERESMKREIREKFNTLLSEGKKGKIKNVFFAEFVIQ